MSLVVVIGAVVVAVLFAQSVIRRSEADAALLRELVGRLLVAPAPEVDPLVAKIEAALAAEPAVDWAGQPTYGIDPTDGVFPDPLPMDSASRAVSIPPGQPWPFEFPIEPVEPEVEPDREDVAWPT